jgi:serine protease Do
LLVLGVLLLGIAVAGAGLDVFTNGGRQPEARRPALVTAPVNPPVLSNTEAIRQASGISDAFITISQAVTPGVVRIQAEQREGAAGNWFPSRLFEFFGPRADSTQEPLPPQVAGGSGFLVSADGYVLTNNHVIENADRITVTLSDKRVFDAEIIGRDPTTDLAVLRIPGEGLPALALGNSDEARVGEWVIAIGNPGFDDASTLDFTVTGGIISAKGRPLRIPQILEDGETPGPNYSIDDFIQTDAVINPGNSGGPLVDLRGMVIGVNTAIASTTGFSQGYGFAIPSNLVQRVVKDLVAYGHVRRPVLGITINEVAPEDAELYRLPSIAGVLVVDFAEDSPGRKAGLERHDVIITVDGKPVERVGQLQRMIAMKDPGDTVRVSVIRWGETRQFTIRLAQAPLPEISEPVRRAAPTSEAGPGVEVADLDASAARKYGYTKPGGVVISRVVPFGAADRKGVQEGLRLVAVGRTRVNDSRDARSLLRASARGSVVSLLLERPNGSTSIANIRIP